MEWKDINGFEGKYQISEDGRVRSIGRVVKNKCGTMTVNERILKPWIDTWGYKNVCLCNNGKCQSKKVHRLIAEAFVPPYSGEQVNPTEAVADYLLDSGVTVQEWISVKDRLPEFCVSVLARCFYHGKWRTLVCHTSKENAGEWYTDEVCQWVKVTHWMPLPQPPKGE